MMHPPRLSLLAVILASALGLVGQEGDLAERLFLSGERAYAAKSYAEAFETWGQILKQAPGTEFAAQALLRMARHQVEIGGKPQEALALLDRIRADHMESPAAPEALLMRGTLLAARARNATESREAIGEFNRLVDLFPSHPAATEAYHHLGLAYRRQGQWLRALQNQIEVQRRDPATPVARRAMLQAADLLDLTGNLTACLRMLQSIRNLAPDSPEAAEAATGILLRVRHRIQKPPFRVEGPWPQGRKEWLKSPTLLSMAANGSLYIYQDGLDQLSRLQEDRLVPVLSEQKGLRAVVHPRDGALWTLAPKIGLQKGSSAPVALPGAPSCAALDPWDTLWIGDGKAGQITLLSSDGTSRTLPSPAATAMAPHPGGGVVLASDANRSLLLLDASGHPKATIPYGQGLPAPFRYVLALASDASGHIAAITDGGDYSGLVLWGPDGTLLRSATFKSLGLSGKYRGIALDAAGGVILADRSNDLLVRVH